MKKCNYSNNLFAKGFVLFVVFLLILSSCFPTATAFTASRVTNLENVSSVTVTVNDENSKKSIDKIPLLNQMDYDYADFGPEGSIADHGCGLVCMAMVATYMMDEFVDPVKLAQKYGSYTNKDGSLLVLFKVAAEEIGLKMDLSRYAHGEWLDHESWDRVVTAVKNGQPVIALYRGESWFSNGGHFVLITGMTEDGKFMVNDPNGWNWSRAELADGFKNGFREDQIRYGIVSYWIYSTKEEYKASLAESVG